MPFEHTDDPLFVTAIDHRFDFLEELVGASGDSVSAADLERAAHLKGIVFAGLAAAVEAGMPKSQMAVWSESDLGEAVLLRARGMSMPTITSVERPGRTHFQFQNPLGFGERLDALGASFAGALVNHNVQGELAESEGHLQSLRRLSEVCRGQGPELMIQLQIAPTRKQTREFGRLDDWDSEYRAEILIESLKTLQDAGVEPHVWAFEAPLNAKAAITIVAQALVDDRNGTGVLLVAGNDHASPVDDSATGEMVALAARTPGVRGLVIGPAAYYRPLADYNSGEIGRGAAVEQIAGNIGGLGGTFINARSTSDVS